MTEVRRATVDEVPALAALLAGAFVDDAIMRWTAPVDGREEVVRAFFAGFDARTAANGWLWTADDGAGVALWVPPGTGAEFDVLTFDLGDGVRELLGGASGRYDSFWEWAEGKRPTERHWYLDHIAVEPGARGAGVGTALVEHGLALALADGAPAFLCTSRPANVGYYERRGFAVEEAADAPGGGPHVWFMRAEP